MKFLLDTNICIYLIKERFPDLHQRLLQHRPSEIGVPAIVAYELCYGAEKSLHPERNDRALRRFLSPFDILAFEDEDASEAGRIRADLERQGQTIGAYDLLIAGQARGRDLTLVTNNEREFSRVEGLRLENWVG